jgi:carbamoyltransferase
MNEDRATLGIYGIQDRLDSEYPQYVHDHNIVLFQNGKIEKFLQLERLTRIKRDNKLYTHLPQIIKEAKLVNEPIDTVFTDNVVGRAFISTNGQIRFEAPLNPRLTKEAEKGKLWWFDHEADGYVLNHELAHIFSCLPFYGDFEENSLLVHFDGGASLSGFSAWIYRMGKIIPVEHHWEMKTFTSLFNANALTFGIIGATIEDQNSVPGKLMGYAALGNYSEEIDFWLRGNNWFENIWGNRAIFFEKAKSDFGIDLKSFDQRNTFLQDVAATIQELFMRETLLKLDDLNTLSGCKNLYYTGGCALNIHTNAAIIESRIFEKVFIPPCTDDSGLAIGAAAFLEWKKGHAIRKHLPYLNNWGIEDYKVEYTPEDLSGVAELLTQGKVLAVCNGFGEAGPRSLGNRSILALTTKALAHKVSVDHKQREWYRPVAPVMLEKNGCYFTDQKKMHPLTKYMLLENKIADDKQAEIPGVIHANGTARIQTLFEKNDNPFLFDLLTLLDEHYNIKALINTSFNSKGKPMVHTKADALSCAAEMNIEYLVFNGKIIELG